ncbi:zinc-binding dehydrogenase [Psychromonas sp. 14N.309.X.WAT.B.A12]|uniref:zinc-binding dehydrogenase n=1 Tax=Psychromonas sp. 14N.309.X.WAT.B.A12 TaxID=2998322 RepID=UPI0025B1FF04|nr:zinc-binding dehydrogenase [Psychromonas sp. 14N.309.X.WAT.B.A12]MDN2664268.1 zinc-binding dehydrogenase [Psychromonas sp. 14N.309.X.WAT.B.A12]
MDLVAGKMWPQFLTLLKAKRRYAVSGAIGGPLVELDVRTLYLKDLSFFGCTVLEPEIFQNLVNCIEQGKIKPVISQTFPMQSIATAQEVFLTKQHVGKIILEIEQP